MEYADFSVDDALRIARATRISEAVHGTAPGKRAPLGGGNPNRVAFHNGSGVALDKGSVVEFTAHRLPGLIKEDVFLFDGDESTGKDKWGVVAWRTPDDEHGQAYVTGPCVALVNVTDTAHQYAKVESGSTVLQSASAGPVLILHHNGVAEEQLCPVVIRGESGERHWLLKADADVAPGTSGTFSIWKGPSGSETDTTENLTFFNRTGLQIDEGTWAKGLTINGERYAEPWDCPAGGA